MTNKLALVIDDSRVARMMLCKLLQSSGFEVVEQGSADEALAWLHNTDQLPLIIFMDLMMPGMDGLTATRQIKNDSRWQSIPVVLCTSNDSEADKLSAHESGVLALLSKPPEAQQLQSILNDLISPVEAALEIIQPAEELSSFSETLPAPSLDEVIAEVEQQLLPAWLQQSQHSAEKISQRIAENVSRHLMDERLNGLAEQLSTQLTEQLTAGIQHKVEQQLATQAAQMQTVLSEKAADAAETAMQNLNQSNHWQQQVSSQTARWLSDQQQLIQQQLMSALQPQIEALITEQLTSLSNTETPMMETLHEELAQLQLMQAQLVKRQRMKGALVMVALAAGIFALLQINLF
ncbi:MAG: response regulator [Methylophaga nitratireducenticrescens]|uniref:response regulator n=1 Tax=Methylophaga sp. SB9B TaxID=2570356 RepID=UPI0010A88AAF|nr:response regulator [Methylophaga sp. SB9B]THF55165.1 MAG: response regulator [Methylophaga nitratireducenticrescens]THK41033.1 response regulator [Methylophaga sp. SB9B]